MVTSEAVFNHFWERAEEANGCWNWTGSTDHQGYGRLILGGKHYVAHRAAYEMINGAIPKGLMLDHLCRNPSCVNLEHLEVVTNRDNVIRGKTVQLRHLRKPTPLLTHCRRGHELTEDNCVWEIKDNQGNRRRKCRTCRDENNRRYYLQRKMA